MSTEWQPSRYVVEDEDDGWYIRDRHRNVFISERPFTDPRLAEEIVTELNELYDRS